MGKCIFGKNKVFKLRGTFEGIQLREVTPKRGSVFDFVIKVEIGPKLQTLLSENPEFFGQVQEHSGNLTATSFSASMKNFVYLSRLYIFYNQRRLHLNNPDTFVIRKPCFRSIGSLFNFLEIYTVDVATNKITSTTLHKFLPLFIRECVPCAPEDFVRIESWTAQMSSRVVTVPPPGAPSANYLPPTDPPPPLNLAVGSQLQREGFPLMHQQQLNVQQLHQLPSGNFSFFSSDDSDEALRAQQSEVRSSYPESAYNTMSAPPMFALGSLDGAEFSGAKEPSIPVHDPPFNTTFQAAPTFLSESTSQMGPGATLLLPTQANSLGVPSATMNCQQLYQHFLRKQMHYQSQQHLQYPYLPQLAQDLPTATQAPPASPSHEFKTSPSLYPPPPPGME